MAVVTMRQLLEAGVHFGHQTRRWNPKMKRFIYGERNGIYIIDLQKTSTAIESTYGFLRDTVAKGGNVLFVGTKKQAQESIKTQAERVGMPYVNFRWLGGMLTNFTTIYRRLQRLKELEAMVATGATEVLPKKEVLRLGHEREKLERNLGGIRDMTRLPAAVWVVDTRKEHIAVTEARKLGIPVVAILDTNCDPDEVDYPIPGNDDAIRAGSLLTRIVADAVAEGLRLRSVYASEAGGKEGAAAIGASPADEEPLAEWERELLESGSGDQGATGRFGRDAAAAAPATASAEQPAAEAKGRTTQARSSAKAGPARASQTKASSAETTGTKATPTEGTPTEGTPTEGTPTEGTPTRGSSPETSRTRGSSRAVQSEATPSEATQGESAPAATPAGATQAEAPPAGATQAEAPPPRATGAGGRKAEASEAGATPPAATKRGAAQPDATGPEATSAEPDATAADATEPEAASAEATETDEAGAAQADASAEETPAEAAEAAADPTNERRAPRV